MGSGNCRGFCPKAQNQEKEIISSHIIVDPNQVSILQRKGRASRRNSQDDKDNKESDYECVSETPSTRNFEKPAEVESKYAQNHIVVPSQIVLRKVPDQVRTFLRKQLPESALLDNQSVWFLMPSGNYYSGEFQAGNPTIGTYLLANGNVYYGKTLAGKPNGDGVYVTKGEVLKGEFKNGEANGKCRLETTDMVIEGDWTNGFVTEGKVDTKDFTYQGAMKNNLPEGKGKYRHLSSDITYQGDFQNGLYHGGGILKTPDYTYKGEFKEGKKNGFGKIEYNDKISSAQSGQWNMDVLLV